MGFFEWLFGNPKETIPTIPSILPEIAKNEIRSGRLPHINVNELFTRRGEICHYADHAILVVKKDKSVRTSRHYGLSTPGIFKGDRFYTGHSVDTLNKQFETEYRKGMLYITNRRIIFTAKDGGFDKQYMYLSSIKPFKNAIELQYGSTIFSIFVPDGIIAYTAIQLLK